MEGLTITPVDKALFLDLLDPSYKVSPTQTIKAGIKSCPQTVLLPAFNILEILRALR